MASSMKTLETLLKTLVQPPKGDTKGQADNQRFIEIQKEVEKELKTLSTNELKYQNLPNFSDMQTAFATEGLEGVMTHIQNTLENWKTVPVNIAIIGQSGSGKSSFINAVRGLTPEDDGAAKTGETEETLKPQQYSHPDNESVVFWDLPGVGTPTFPREGYLEKICFDRYDFYIIITSDRFKDDDLWLAKQIQETNKKFYFIRSKVDQDIWNARHDYPNSFNEDLTLQNIKENCVKNLANGGFRSPPIFIISNRNKYKWDFPKAIEKLHMDIPEVKREAIAFSLSNLSIHTYKIIEMKKEFLANRARAVAVKAAIGSVCPLPEIGVNLDKKALEDEEKFYRQQFGIGNKMMEEHRSTVEQQIERAVEVKYALNTTTEFIANKLKECADAYSFISVIFRIGKMATDAAVSYKLARVTLQGIQDEYAQIALQSALKLIGLKAFEL